jgi:hypothetical protein
MASQVEEWAGVLSEEDEDTQLTVAFLLGLGGRLESMANKGLLPYDPSPLLRRMRELTRAVG